MSAAPTTPPPAALDCDGWPCCLRAGCGLCAQWARDTATVPAVGPCQERAYQAALDRALAALCDAMRAHVALRNSGNAEVSRELATTRRTLQRLRDEASG